MSFLEAVLPTRQPSRTWSPAEKPCGRPRREAMSWPLTPSLRTFSSYTVATVTCRHWCAWRRSRWLCSDENGWRGWRERKTKRRTSSRSGTLTSSIGSHDGHVTNHLTSCDYITWHHQLGFYLFLFQSVLNVSIILFLMKFLMIIIIGKNL